MGPDLVGRRLVGITKLCRGVFARLAAHLKGARRSSQLAGWLAVQLAGWLASWLAGMLAAWLAGWLYCWLTALLAGWLADWLAD